MSRKPKMNRGRLCSNADIKLAINYDYEGRTGSEDDEEIDFSDSTTRSQYEVW